MQIQQLDKEYIAGTYKRADVVFTKGKGSLLWDENGKEYIDLGTGIAVNGLGVADDGWVEAVTAQLTRLPHASNLYFTSPQAELAQTLCARTGMKKVFFGNSGAEANEAAIKCARKYAFDIYGDASHSTIITLKNSFHGRTVTTLAATGQDVFHTKFDPFTPGFVYATANDLDSVKRLSEENDCCAVMMELVQGEGGVCSLDEDFVHGVEALCREKNMLLVIDEVQTGNGRCGALYAYMRYGIQPDIVSTAKGLAGGLPMGATLLGEKVQNTLDAGSHGSTFGGNPVCAAGALYVLSQIDEALLQSVREKSAYICETLQNTKGVKSVSGLGLMLGIETEKPAGEIVNACREKGVVCLTAKTKVRLLPALNIPMEQLQKAIGILKEVIEQ